MKVKITATVSRLLFHFPFRIAHGMRTGTDVVFARAECDGAVGFGEATLPPYLLDTAEGVVQFLNLPDVKNIEFPFHPSTVFDRLDKKHKGNMPAKAALDMALWNLLAATEKKSLSELLHVIPDKKIPHTYTIGIGTRDEMKQKLEHGLSCGFDFFKLKMDGIIDEKIIDDYKSMSELPFAVDANQAWKNLDVAINLGKKLEQAGCILLEQPFHKSDREMSAALKSELNIPMIADEACQRLTDILSLKNSFDGINIKLQKCGGITEAIRMIDEAKKLGLKILIGCMSESSIGCDAAENLAPLCDWADLDGTYLNFNNDQIVHLAQKK